MDTADPADVTMRPNQVIAMSLPFGPARGERRQEGRDGGRALRRRLQLTLLLLV